MTTLQNYAMDIIVLAMISVLVFFATRRIFREKKQGHCIGCPRSGACTKKFDKEATPCASSSCCKNKNKEIPFL